MHKLLTAVAVLTVLATPASAQSLDQENSSDNVVLSFGAKPAVPQNKISVHQSGVRAYDTFWRPQSTHTTGHGEGKAYNGWGFAPGSCAVAEANDAVGVWLPPQCER